MEWVQLDDESARAYEAFCVYRDLGAQRSLNGAYQRQSGATSAAPGTWTAWSGDHAWVARAEAYDKHREAERLAVRDERYRELERRRIDFEFENQDRLERRVRLIEKILDKADIHPVTDVTSEKDSKVEDISLATVTTTFTKTKVKGISLSGYARLSQQANDTAKQAVLGIRPEASEKRSVAGNEAKKDAPGIQKGEFAWIKINPSEET